MAFQPPTRPHTANPRVVLNTSIFHPRPGSAASNRTTTSVSSANANTNKGHDRRKSRDREHEWEDAWDSGSDHDDLDQQPSASGNGRTNGAGNGQGRGHVPAPIPIRSQSHHRQDSGGSNIAASWASGSYQHVSHRPTLSASKTYTEGAPPPPPGTAVHSEPMEPSSTSASGSRLPPGGAWEIIEPVHEVKEVVVPVKVGKEAIRDNVDDILKGQSRLVVGEYGYVIDGRADDLRPSPAVSVSTSLIVSAPNTDLGTYQPIFGFPILVIWPRQLHSAGL